MSGIFGRLRELWEENPGRVKLIAGAVVFLVLVTYVIVSGSTQPPPEPGRAASPSDASTTSSSNSNLFPGPSDMPVSSTPPPSDPPPGNPEVSVDPSFVDVEPPPPTGEAQKIDEQQAMKIAEDFVKNWLNTSKGEQEWRNRVLPLVAQHFRRTLGSTNVSRIPQTTVKTGSSAIMVNDGYIAKVRVTLENSTVLIVTFSRPYATSPFEISSLVPEAPHE